MQKNFVKQTLPFKISNEDLIKNPLNVAYNSIFHISLTWFLIFSILLISELFASYIVSFLLCVFMGGAQHRFFTIYHEAFHGNLFTNKYLNKYIAIIFASYPSFSTYESAKIRHINHHRKTATTDDPERVSHIRSIGDFVQVVFPHLKIVKIFLNKIGFNFYIGKVDGRGENNLDDTSSIREVPILVIFNLLLIFLLYNIFPNSFGIYYLSLFTFMPIFSMIRSWVEHYNDDQNNNPAFRVNTYANKIERFFFAPMSFNFHLLHHSNMGIPHFELERLTNKYYAQISEIEVKRSSYIKTFIKYFFKFR